MNFTEENRRLVEHFFRELERGNRIPFRDAMADDIRWVLTGSSAWSRTFEGKAVVVNQLLGPVRDRVVEGRIDLTVQRILADGDHVVVQAAGRAVTTNGKPYNNEYCFVYRLAGGKMVAVTEYCDTQLASEALGSPPWAAPGA